MGETEHLTLCSDRASGMRAVVAIDDTTLGPGLGGVRWMSYPTERAAIRECARLARVMTLKNACADLPYGGAKSVMFGAESQYDRRAVLRAFGRSVCRLGGAYIPGVDMGTSVDDLAQIGATAAGVACTDEDPSAFTALGVFAGIAAAADHRGLGGVGRLKVLVQGAGHVGSELARQLASAGACVGVADVDDRRARSLVDEIGGVLVAPEAVVEWPCDVLAPCATARVLSCGNVPALGARIVAGGANDVLTERRCASHLAARGITYVPDFLVNAGGVVHIHALRSGWGSDKLEESVRAIGDRVRAVLVEADSTRRTSIDVAEELASERIGRPITLLE